MMNISRYVTISVDDGHPLDVRTAELLEKYRLKATFYVPAKNEEHEVLSIYNLREISSRFEVGAHTYNHVALSRLDSQEIIQEVSSGKKWLEDSTGCSVSSFCYPKGKFNSRVVQVVKEAGFLGARTCVFNLNGFPSDPFTAGVSTHGFSHARAIQIRHAVLGMHVESLWNYAALFHFKQDWVEHFSRALLFVEKYGGVAHLYIHSWEIEEQREWDRLEKVFKLISFHKQLSPITNGELFELCHLKQGRSKNHECVQSQR